MPSRAAARAALLAVIAAAPLRAQLAPPPPPSPPELRYEPELKIELAKHNIMRSEVVAVSRRGTFVVLHHIYPTAALVLFDSLGQRHNWPLQVGGRDPDIGWIGDVGWVGDSLWIADQRIPQLAVIDTSGKIVRSIERPSWVRPFWRDRRKYPLFRSLTWQALYRDGSALILPASPRPIFDTPEFDRSKAHVLRVNADGKVLKTVAKLPSGAVGLQLRDGTEKTTIHNPFYVKHAWHVSEDGQRVVIVKPLMTAADSGAFIVMALDANGDTVFSRRHTVPTRRVPTADVEKYLAGVKAYGRYSAEWIRDTLRKQIPVFESRVTIARVGMDNSVWVYLRSDVPETRALVLDQRGNAVGTVSFPFQTRPVAVTEQRVWASQREGSMRNPQFNLVRFRLTRPTGAPPVRGASASTSPR